MTLVDTFEAERPRLINVAYRLTGSVADAEDAVQEAWLRLDRASTRTPIDNLQAWLTTVVSRLCLDRLTSAAARRETYVGQWLPEPIVTPITSSTSSGDIARDPLETVVSDEDNRFAALVVLEVLPPDQRVAFVLHDAFGVPFDEVAEVLGVQTANARQLASRARRTVADPPPPVPDEEHNAAVGRFLEAMATGDLNAVLATLHPDALVMGDANGTTNTAVNVIHGAEKFARFYLGLLQRYGPNALTNLQLVLVNGQLGVATSGWQGDTTRNSSPPRVAGFAVRDGLVCATYDVANPEKWSGVRLPDWPARPGQ
ncbi:sigma-70 family RNA polymerase sigma factor [Aeromicrobium ginsengisoli]|uniref:Sigma-70 family RNA polymerase sigma factor n=1 Tax=Aeromicrobium ginsengisoli TaxID=363867 RepID=A0A5M4FBK6_9ACTN|nr:sigma-70 family RNA polymerase sigma factor [Aeromicrobium ginsengisoli]KAA1395786.1 sigma-70 family RNA polymerase sigma factor [Aeromicrobium ginsengisoli]